MDETQKADASTPPASMTKKSGGVKEMIESILVAFILAFIFRAFVVEAFVIPTGSMAPTLLGAHTRYTCSDCGHAFTVNYAAGVEGGDVSIPPKAVVRRTIEKRDADMNRFYVTDWKTKTYSLYCPNCGYKIPKDQATGPAVHYGDRILVLKYLYLFQDPARWDVVVFKSPTPDEDSVYRYQTNYIKRLIGKPGESILLLDGDVYVSNSTAETLGPDDFKVQTKPKVVQDALWRIVYDNDFYPRGRKRADGSTWQQPWMPAAGEKGWDVGGKDERAFRFDNADGSSTLSFDPTASPNASPLTDWLAYNQVPQLKQGLDSDPDTYHLDPYKGESPVSDLRLTFHYNRQSGDGPLQLRLSKFDRLFTAEIFPDHVRLLMRRGSGPDQIVVAETPIKLKANSKIDFQNVDYQVTLRIDEETVFTTSPAQYAPDVKQLLAQFERNQQPPPPTVQIVGNQQTCALSHVSLWRDVYYTNRGQNIRWAIPNDFPRNIVRLGKDEFFVMGDNSPVSWDARFWGGDISLADEDLLVESGRVPARFMLGKAFFVYWPAGFKPLPSGYSVTPNFGEMRFIH